MNAPFQPGQLILHPPSRGGGWKIVPPRPLPVERLLVGRRVEEAVRLVPLLFNVCAAAQLVAVRAAFGLPDDPAHRRALVAERIREHRRKLWFELPALMGLNGGGAEERLIEETPSGLDSWMRRAGAAGAVLRRLMAWPEEVGRVHLPLFDASPDWPHPLCGGMPVENSLAVLWRGHPLLDWIETRRGRGPVWRFVLRLLDYSALADGAGPGLGAVTARGRLLVRAELEEGRVRCFERLTPTDFLVVPDGLLARLVEGLTVDDPRLPVLVALADPCVSWIIREKAEGTTERGGRIHA